MTNSIERVVVLVRFLAVLIVVGLTFVGAIDQAFANGNPAADRIPDVRSIELPDLPEAAAGHAPEAVPPEAAAPGLEMAKRAGRP
jgi:hypothetical protein